MVATKLSTCFLNHAWIGGNSTQSNLDFLFIRHHHFHPRLSPPPCKMRPRSFSAQHKRQLLKKNSPKEPQIDAKLQPNGGARMELKNTSLNGDSSSRNEIIPKNDADGILVSEQVSQNNLEDLTNLDDNVLLLPPPQQNHLIVSQLDSSNVIHDIDAHSDSMSLSLNIKGEQQLSPIQFEDLVGMIRNAEENVLLLSNSNSST